MHQAPPPPDRSRWQKILNEHWPLVDRQGNRHARGVPDQKHPIAVRVRVVWERDGETWLDGMARRWTTGPRAAVYVSIDDERNNTSGVVFR